MPRRPEVFVRSISVADGRRLRKLGRSAKYPVKLRRSIVVLSSAQGQSVPDIAHLLTCSQDYVRELIHAFSEKDFANGVQNGAWAHRGRSMSPPGAELRDCRV
jgi:hypothetical protein